MSFSQKGIDKLRIHQENSKMRHPEGKFYASEGFDDGMCGRCQTSKCLLTSLAALNWFREHFLKCNERAALVKTWLPQSNSRRNHVDQLDHLLYDRALMLVCLSFTQACNGTKFALQSKTAARKELLDKATTPDECEKLYEESLWCLYALQDDLLLQAGNPFLDEDRATIASCKFSIILDC